MYVVDNVCTTSALNAVVRGISVMHMYASTRQVKADIGKATERTLHKEIGSKCMDSTVPPRKS